MSFVLKMLILFLSSPPIPVKLTLFALKYYNNNNNNNNNNNINNKLTSVSLQSSILCSLLGSASRPLAASNAGLSGSTGL